MIHLFELFLLKGVCHIAFLIKYRRVPVTVLPEEWFYPVNAILAFPTGMAGKRMFEAFVSIAGTSQYLNTNFYNYYGFVYPSYIPSAF